MIYYDSIVRYFPEALKQSSCDPSGILRLGVVVVVFFLYIFNKSTHSQHTVAYSIGILLFSDAILCLFLLFKCIRNHFLQGEITYIYI